MKTRLRGGAGRGREGAAGGGLSGEREFGRKRKEEEEEEETCDRE